MKTTYIVSIIVAGLLSGLSACKKDFLEKEPLSTISPKDYLKEESQLASYAVKLYEDLPIFGYLDGDVHTDIEARRTYDARYVPGQWRVGQTGGQWNFTDIFQCNYFLSAVLPRLANGEIAGNTANINHYIGEVYFMRALAYFTRMQSLGDFPIVKAPLIDDRAVLVEASKRAPQNEVARFILSDLDSAITMMGVTAPSGGSNRLSKACAQLLKSRVALYEATFLKYFKGTAFVPNGPGWPGKTKDYNASYQFPSGSIENEIVYFLDRAMQSAKLVADATPLVNNTMTQETQTTNEDFAAASDLNPYCKMFCDEDLSPYKEVLLWKDYDLGLGISNAIPNVIQSHRDWG